MNPLKIGYLILKSIPLSLLLRIRIKIKNLKGKMKMAKSSEGKTVKEPREKELKKSQEQTTKEVKVKDEDQEIKPSFQELLSKEKKNQPSTESSEKSSPPGSTEVDENIIEVCADVIGIPFAIWHELNPNVPPLSDKETINISRPLAKVVAKYDLGRLMKEEYVLVFYLGSAIYRRGKIKPPVKASKAKKDDKDDYRKTGTGQDKPDTRINQKESS